MGGSKGARSINNALIQLLPSLLSKAQVIHLSGSLDFEDVKVKTSGLKPELQQNYRLFPYLHAEMGAAFASADLALCRAGASTLGELPLYGLPAILVPYPYAWRYQKVNADFLVENGAAVLLPNEELEQRLGSTIRELLGNPKELAEMKQKMHALARPQAAEEIARLLVDLCGRSGRVQAA